MAAFLPVLHAVACPHLGVLLAHLGGFLAADVAEHIVLPFVIPPVVVIMFFMAEFLAADADFPVIFLVVHQVYLIVVPVIVIRVAVGANLPVHRAVFAPGVAVARMGAFLLGHGDDLFAGQALFLQALDDGLPDVAAVLDHHGVLILVQLHAVQFQIHAVPEFVVGVGSAFLNIQHLGVLNALHRAGGSGPAIAAERGHIVLHIHQLPRVEDALVPVHALIADLVMLGIVPVIGNGAVRLLFHRVGAEGAGAPVPVGVKFVHDVVTFLGRLVAHHAGASADAAAQVMVGIVIFPKAVGVMILRFACPLTVFRGALLPVLSIIEAPFLDVGFLVFLELAYFALHEMAVIVPFGLIEAFVPMVFPGIGRFPMADRAGLPMFVQVGIPAVHDVAAPQFLYFLAAEMAVRPVLAFVRRPNAGFAFFLGFFLGIAAAFLGAGDPVVSLARGLPCRGVGLNVQHLVALVAFVPMVAGVPLFACFLMGAGVGFFDLDHPFAGGLGLHGPDLDDPGFTAVLLGADGHLLGVVLALGQLFAVQLQADLIHVLLGVFLLGVAYAGHGGLAQVFDRRGQGNPHGIRAFGAGIQAAILTVRPITGHALNHFMGHGNGKLLLAYVAFPVMAAVPLADEADPAVVNAAFPYRIVIAASAVCGDRSVMVYHRLGSLDVVLFRFAKVSVAVRAVLLMPFFSQ